MFDKQQLEIIKEVGREGLSLRVAASRIGMVHGKFMSEYEENEEAQLAYESGQAELEVEVVTVAKAGFIDDQKKFDFLANTVLNMDGKNTAKNIQTKQKTAAVPKELFNPTSLLELDDEELKRKAEQKLIEESKKVKPITDKNGEEQ